MSQRRFRWATCLAVLPIAWLAGCRETTGVLPDVIVSTDAGTYVAATVPGNGALAHYAFEVVVRTENRATTPVLLERCFENDVRPMYDIALVDAPAGARSAYTVFWGCPATATPLTLPAGATRHDTLKFHGSARQGGSTSLPVEELEGRMRVTITSRTRLLQSNAFTVSRAP